MNVLTVAMAFVVAVRLLVEGVAFAIAVPIKAVSSRLPETDPPSFPRLTRLKEFVATETLGRLPEWVEYDGSGMFLLKTTAGEARLDRLVHRIPDRVMAGWLRFGIGAVVVFLVAWAALLLVGLAGALRTGVLLVGAAVDWAMTFDWASLLEPQPTPEVDLIAQLQQLVAAMPELLHTGAVFLLYAGVGIVLSWGLMVFILPGIALHEFGHYAAARRAGASVDSYGLLLLGPVLGGAYVEPGDDAEDLPADKKYGIWAAGIGNSMLWGTVLLAGGLALSGDPGAVLFGWLLQDFGVFTSQPVASLLLALGIMEVANSFLNAMPFGPVDGGGFVRTAEEDLWGLDETTPFDRRIRQLLGDEAEPQQ